MTSLLSFFALIVLTCQEVHAFTHPFSDKGNGGDVLVCAQPPEGQETEEDFIPVEILDFYSWREIEGKNYQPLDLGQEDWNYEQKVFHVIDRLETINPTRAKIYRAWAEEFISGEVVEFLKDKTFDDIPDHGYIPIPSHCEIQQIAIQRPYHAPNTPRYLINENLWDQMDHNSKAGLILHEIVYREAISAGHTNSVRTRFFVGHLASSSIDLNGNWEYFQIAEHVFENKQYFENPLKKLLTAQIANQEIIDVELYPSGNLRSIQLNTSLRNLSLLLSEVGDQLTTVQFKPILYKPLIFADQTNLKVIEGYGEITFPQIKFHELISFNYFHIGDHHIKLKYIDINGIVLNEAILFEKINGLEIIQSNYGDLRTITGSPLQVRFLTSHFDRVRINVSGDLHSIKERQNKYGFSIRFETRQSSMIYQHHLKKFVFVLREMPSIVNLVFESMLGWESIRLYGINVKQLNRDHYKGIAYKVNDYRPTVLELVKANHEVMIDLKPGSTFVIEPFFSSMQFVPNHDVRLIDQFNSDGSPKSYHSIGKGREVELYWSSINDKITITQ